VAVTPAVLLADQLLAARRAGVSFMEAWPVSLAAALEATREREEWADVLGGMAPTWRAAFDRQAPAVPSPLYLLSEGGGEEIPAGVCAHCGEELPAEAHERRVYCDRLCAGAARRERDAA
jgi:hypothetical protein